MPDIFKVCYLKNNLIEKIDVYSGSYESSDGINLSLSKKYSEKSLDISKESFHDESLSTNKSGGMLDMIIFNDTERENISKNNIEVRYVDTFIYLDDTIEIIKKKIIKNSKISFEELYLFCSYKGTIDSYIVYQELTQNGKLELNNIRLIQFLLNINQGELIEKLESKDIYNYDDILELKLDNKELLIEKSLGQKFVAGDKPLSFTVNPYNVVLYDTFIEKYADELIATTNKSLLMTTFESGITIYNNTIYVCEANDVLNSMSDKSLSIISSIKIYFPYLIRNEINSIELLKLNKDKLQLKSEKLFDNNFERMTKNIDLFYNIYNKRNTELDYTEKGINSVELIIHPINEYNLPLDILFKIIHTSKSVPFIKYNPSKKMEKIYRLYTNKISTKGKKIPYLNKSHIFKLMKTIGNSKSVAVYIEYEYKSDIIPITCEFYNNASIYVSALLKNLTNENEINEILKNSLNPIIELVKRSLEQSGYTLPLFNSLYNKNIEILDIKYSCSIEIDRTINLSKIIGCVSSIFNVEDGNLKNGINMRFKRVSNYSEMDSQESFIIDLLNKDKSQDEIIDLIVKNFNLDEKKARIKFAEVISSMEVVHNLYKKKQIKIKNNPGFLTTIIQEKFKNSIIITVTNINNIFYLSTIPIYLDTLIRITQNPESTEVPIEEINNLCLQKIIKDKEKIQEIVAPSEKSYPENEETNIVAQELVFDSGEKSPSVKGDNFLDLLLGSDNDEDEMEEDEEEKEKTDIESEVIYGGADIEVGSELDSDSEEELSKKPDIKIGSELDSDSEKEQEEEEEEEEEEELSKKLDIKIGSELDSGSEKEEEPEQEELSKKPDIKIGSELDSELDSGSEKEEPEQEEVSKKPDIKIGSELDSELDSESEKEEEQQEEASKKPEIKIGSELDMDYQEQDEPPIKIGTELDMDSEEEDTTSEKKEIKSIIIKSKKSKEKVKEQEKSIKIKIKQKTTKEDTSKETIESGKLIQDITGMSLSNPNPFSERLEERDPKLFVISEKDGKYNAYSRQCQWNARRQPVILTDKEKARIDKLHPGSYDEAIKYGSNPDKQYWYICPRYWSLTENTSLTEEEVKSGKYGKVIPEKAKKVPKDASIFEFTDSRVHKGRNGEYVKHYPGFILKNDSHPDGLCIPCCFKSWNSPSQQRRREECQKNIVEIDRPKTSVKVDADNYIKSSEKFPLEQNRWGFLPIVIQKFLKTDNKECQISVSNTNLKENHTCLLRHGVEVNSKQSFIGCIADVYIDDKDTNIVPTIKEMKKIIISSMDLDKFITYQNGTLSTVFFKEKEVDIEKYNTSYLYKNIDKTNDDQLTVLTNAIKSYENFVTFLESDSVLIDYTYLWDIVCTPNSKLFELGLNLVILELTNNDLTDNVKLICPTNHYANEFYDINKKCLILIKNGKYFEPIYTLRETDSEYEITRLFSMESKNLLPNLKSTLQIIKTSMDENCARQPSLPEVYKFKENIILSKILYILQKNRYELVKQVLNYNGMVIGVIVRKEDKEGFIPTYPSSLIVDIGDGIVWIDDDIWKSYSDTKDFLININKETNKSILCKPLFKVIEDKLIIGIITETNQFVGINPPEQDMYGDDLKIINESNYLVADKVSILSDKKDTEREKYIKYIKLETGFYNTFRNTIRILLGKIENRQIRKEIENIINTEHFLYQEKIEELDIKLRKLSEESISFIIYNKTLIEKIDEISTCIINNESDCKDSNYCLLSNENKCKLLIPSVNLINGSDNQEIYYKKISDELLRYNRIKHFVFEPQAFLSFSNIKYNLNDDEIIIMHSLLNQEYFDDIEIAVNNKYTRKTTFDIVNPQLLKLPIQKNIKINEIKTKKKLVLKEESKKEVLPDLDDEAKLSEKKAEILDTQPVDTEGEDKKQLDKDIICKTERKSITAKWKPFFPKGIIELSYINDIPICTFDMLLSILQEHIPSSNVKTANELKEILVEEYNKLSDKIYIIGNVLASEGKNEITNKLLLGEIGLDVMIMSENYFITNFDIQLFAIRFNIPIILVSSTKLAENNRPILIVNNDNSGIFYFIKVPGVKINTTPNYRLFVTNNKLSIELSTLSFSFQNDIRISSKFDLNEYLKNFKVKGKKQSKKLKIVETIEKEKEVEDSKKNSKELLISPTDEEELLRQLEEEERKQDVESTLQIPVIKPNKSI